MAALARPLAFALALAIALLLLVAILLWARSEFATPPYVFMRGPGGMLALLVVVATQMVSGVVLAIRRPDLPIGRLALAFAFVVGTTAAACAYLALVDSGLEAPLAPAWVAWWASLLGFAGGALTAVVLGLVFPDGRLPGRRWSMMLGLSAVGAVLTAIGLGLTPGRIVLFPAYDNPVTVADEMTEPLTAVTVLGMAFLALGGAAVSVTLLIRYRRADEVLRVQLRWYIASAIALAVGFGAFLAALATLPYDAALGELVMVAFIATAALPPIALLIAITRYRLYDIDTILSRAFVFGTLTAILAGVYTASIRLFNSLFTLVTGDSSDAALVITTLVIAASFTPLKRRLEALVERRYRTPALLGTDIDGEASPPVTAGAATDGLEDGIVGRVAAAVIADPAFGAAIDARLRLAVPVPTVIPAAEVVQASLQEEPIPEHG